MNMGHRQARTWTRPLTMFLALLILVPAAMLAIALLAYQASLANAQEAQARKLQAARQIEAALVEEKIDARERSTQPIRASNQQPTAVTPSDDYRPVQETRYEERRVEVVEAQVDEKTGKTMFKPRQIVERVPVTETRMVPVTTTRMVPVSHRAAHDPRITQLSSELRRMDGDSENRTAKLKELRQRLELEFAAMHDRQAKEIDATADRLES